MGRRPRVSIPMISLCWHPWRPMQTKPRRVLKPQWSECQNPLLSLSPSGPSLILMLRQKIFACELHRPSISTLPMLVA